MLRIDNLYRWSIITAITFISGQSSFFHGLCFLVRKLLTEKESKVHVSSRARNWLIKEAAANENINKAGTFR